MELQSVRALEAAKAWLVQQGFAEGDALTRLRIDGNLKSPLEHACEQGNLDVCRWLHANASADVTRADNDGRTPMSIACQEGHLSVCQWLFDVGASADIIRADDDGHTPMYVACLIGHLSVCQWLILNGALNDEDDHVDEDILIRDVRSNSRLSAVALQTWSQEMISIHSTFLNVVLRGSVLIPLSQQHVPPHQRCRLPMLDRGVLEVVGSYLGLVTGREFRNVQAACIQRLAW